MNEGELPGFGASLLWTLGATVLVGVLAWLALASLRRVMQGRPARHHRTERRLRVVHSVALGTRERAVLLIDGEREYLLGVAAGGISLLASRPLEAAGGAPGVDDPSPDDGPAVGGGTSASRASDT